MLRRSLLVLVLCSCGSKTPAASAPGAPKTDGAPVECPEDTRVLPPAGSPCAHEGESCGTEGAATATSFTNFMHCQGGHWQIVEVPPPPPH